MRKELKSNWTKNSEVLKYFTLISQLGLVVISALLICFFIGLWIERKFPSNGLFIGLGTIFGVLSGSLAAYKLLKRTILKEDNDE